MVATCHVRGVSTRRMEKLVDTLGITSLPQQQVSVMAKELDKQVEAFRNRSLDAGPHTFVAVDALDAPDSGERPGGERARFGGGRCQRRRLPQDPGCRPANVCDDLNPYKHTCRRAKITMINDSSEISLDGDSLGILPVPESADFRLRLPSFKSLFLDCRWVCNGQDNSLSTATGFIVFSKKEEPYLVTNRHVVTGWNPELRKHLSKHGVGPTHIDVRHNRAGKLGSWITVREALLDEDGNPIWFEHPLGEDVDVAALRLTKEDGIAGYIYGLEPPNEWMDDGSEVSLRPTQALSIIGFPFGEFTGEGMGIWVRGFIASEPDLHHKNLPRFLIDSRTRQGQSGSPVVYTNYGLPIEDRHTGKLSWGNMIPGRLVGVYSGRINAESDLGFVWNLDAIRDTIEHGRLGSLPK